MLNLRRALQPAHYLDARLGRCAPAWGLLTGKSTEPRYFSVVRIKRSTVIYTIGVSYLLTGLNQALNNVQTNLNLGSEK